MDDNNLWQCTTLKNNKKDIFISNGKNKKKFNFKNFLKTKENLEKNINQIIINDNDIVAAGYKESKIIEDDKEKTFTQNNNIISKYPEKDNYITVCSTNRLVNRINKKGISTKSSPNNKSCNNIKTKNKISNRLLNNTIYRHYKSKSIYNNINNYGSYFTLDEFLIPYNSKNPKKNNNEKLYLTKEGNILLNDHQKNLIEKYVNKRVLKGGMNTVSKKNSKNKINTMNNVNSKINATENENEVLKLLKILPDSIQKSIECFINKKHFSFLNRGIFKACQKAIDNYKELEEKEKIFSKKTARNKSNDEKLLKLSTSFSNIRSFKKKFFDIEINSNMDINKTIMNSK